MGVRARTIEVTTTGVAGAATGSARVGIAHGTLLGVQVVYNSMPITTSVVVKCAMGGVEKTILTLAGRNADLPLSTVHEAGLDGTGTPTATLTKPTVGGELVVDVSGANAGSPAVVVTVVTEH